MSIKFNESGIHVKKFNCGYKLEHIAGTREWCVIRDGQCIKICDTRREAQAYINRCI